MYENIKDLIIEGEDEEIIGAVQEAIDGGADPNDLIAAMSSTMDVVGEKFTQGEIFVPEMLICAETMQAGMTVLKPLLAGDAGSNMGKFIIGTVMGDMHDIGKNLVVMMLESAGFEVIDLGVDVAPEEFVKAVKDNPDTKVLGLSGLLTTTMHSTKDTVEAINDAGLHDNLKIMIGGAPTSQAFCDEIGADGYTPDAAAAAAMAKSFVA